MDPAGESLQVPPMILQALVENALKHGIAKVAMSKSTPPPTTVRCSWKWKTAGSSPQPRPARDGDTQIGINNIRERLRLLYGDRASLSLKNGDGVVAATVRIPMTA